MRPAQHATSNPALIGEARDAFASGMHLALLSGAATTVLAVVVVTLLLRRTGKPGTDQAQTPNSGTHSDTAKSAA